MDDLDSIVKDEVFLSIDEIIPFIGEFKRFQWVLGSMFCTMMLPVASQILLMQFAAIDPNWKCVENSTLCVFNGTFPPNNDTRCSLPRSEWEFTEPSSYSIVTYYDINCEKSWLINLLSSITFVGAGIGSVTIGWVSDNYGRKPVLYFSLAMIILSGFVSSFMPNIYFVIACRLLIGIFVIGAFGTSLILSEIVATSYRPIAGVLIWCFYPVALCLLGVKAYFIRNWKILSILCSAPYTFVLLFYFFTPESPRWMRLRGEMKELFRTLRRIAVFNKRKIPSNVNILPVPIEIKQKSNPFHLFRSLKTALLTINLGYAGLVNAMVYYGLSMIAGDLGGSRYINFILLSLTEIPAGIIAMILCDKVGRKLTTVGGLAFAAFACGALAFIFVYDTNNLYRIIFAMIAKLFLTTGFNSLTLWLIELYPTSIRAQGGSINYLISTVGSAAAPWMITGLQNILPSGPYICMGIATITCSVFLCFLPETKGLPTLECEENVSDEYINSYTVEEPFLNEVTS